MKVLKFRIDSQNPMHTRFTVFDDHANAGNLCMDTKNFRALCRALYEDDIWINFEVENNENS